MSFAFSFSVAEPPGAGALGAEPRAGRTGLPPPAMPLPVLTPPPGMGLPAAATDPARPVSPRPGGEKPPEVVAAEALVARLRPPVFLAPETPSDSTVAKAWAELHDAVRAHLKAGRGAKGDGDDDAPADGAGSRRGSGPGDYSVFREAEGGGSGGGWGGGEGSRNGSADVVQSPDGDGDDDDKDASPKSEPALKAVHPAGLVDALFGAGLVPAVLQALHPPSPPALKIKVVDVVTDLVKVSGCNRALSQRLHPVGPQADHSTGLAPPSSAAPRGSVSPTKSKGVARGSAVARGRVKPKPVRARPSDLLIIEELVRIMCAEISGSGLAQQRAFAKLLPKLCRIVPWTTRRSALPFLVAAIASADSADLKVRKTLYDCLLISGWQSVEWPKSFSPLPELLDMLECDYADARKSAAYALQGFIQSEAFLASQKDAIKESRLAGRLAEMIRRTDKEKHTIALRPTLMLFKRVTPDLVPMLLENDLLGALVKYSLGLLVAPAGEEIDPQPGDFELLGTQILCIVYVWTLTICRPSDSFSIMCHGATRFIIDAARRLANSADKFGSRRVAVDGFEPLELDEALMSATRALRKMIELSTQKDFQIDWIPIIFNFGLVPALHAIIDHRDKMIPILKDSIERVLERYDCEAVNLAQVDMEACGMDVLLYRHNNSSRVVKKFFDYISDKADPTPIPNPANEDLVSRSLLRSARSKSRTRVEIRYLQLLGSLLSLPDWWDIFDTPGGPEKLLSHAREYALPDVTEDMLQLAMQELEYRAANEVQTVFGINGTRAIIVPGPVEQTFVSHDAAPAELCKLLARQSHDLEDVPERLVDWRAGTNDMVRDLVNPSLFCLVYGTTVVAASSQRRRHTMQMSLEDLERYGRVTKPPGSVDAAQHASQRFQWLPAEFRVNDDSSIAIQSFINNLHPVWHRDIYKSIAKLFGCFVPLFEMQFGEFRVFDRFRCLHDNPQRMQINIDLWAKRRARELEILELKHVARGDEEVPQDEVAPFAHFSPLDDANDEPAAGQESAAAVSPASSTQEQTTGRKVFRGSPMRFTHEEIKALDAEFGSEDNPLHLPQLPKIFSAPATPLAPANLRGRNLQVIVRMSNIYLTPAKPVYQPDWAVHGSWNEPIVVTGILCYDVANIADPRLAFRRPVMAFSTRVLEPDGDPRVRPETNTQFLGRIALKEGCSLSFPNLFQHKFENIELADATQPGHLKMLEFHVIDPAMSLVSTAHVSPQQLEWYAVGLEGRLPPELLTLMIKDKVKLDEAKRFQREFELERAALGAVLNRTL